MSANVDLRKQFNSVVKPQYRTNHTPQCRKCMKFSSWGDGVIEIHHKNSLIDGGTNDNDNLITLCKECHQEWHMKYDDGNHEFSSWLQKPPLWMFSAIAMNDDLEMRNKQFDYLENNWANIKDQLMITQPYKTDELKKYVKIHSSEWIDW